MALPNVFTKIISRVQVVSPKTGMASNNVTRTIGTNNVLNTVKTVAQRNGRNESTVELRTPVQIKPAAMVNTSPVQISSKTASVAKIFDRTLKKAVINASDRLKPKVNLQTKTPNQVDISNRPKTGFISANKGVARWGLSYRDYTSTAPRDRATLVDDIPLRKASEVLVPANAAPTSIPKTQVSISGTEVMRGTIEEYTTSTSAAVNPDLDGTDNRNSTLFLIGALALGFVILRSR